MSTSSFQMSSFIPVDGTIVHQSSTSVSFSFSSAYVTHISVDMWSEDDQGATYAVGQETDTNGTDDAGLSFAVPAAVDLHYKITVSGDPGSNNIVHVRIEW
ncbi:hypothetical protein ACFC58_29270 [Kitasatospora purpeofusca]|uniref:hypothetical protein n=1 Tax=Kitasatospora purpeofusca TaxID=67352 RepID=UPI0035D88E0D